MFNKIKKGYCAFVAVILIAFLLAGTTASVLYFSNLPPISQLESFQPTLVSQIVSSDDVVIKTFGAYKYKKVKLESVPTNLTKALIATEDKNFYTHMGFDPVALLRSTLSNIKAGHVVQGASTLTQQLARILFLSTEQTFDRKIKELIIAYRLEKSLPKNKILEMYLNNVYLGEGAYGVSAAAEIYFNKNVSNLNLPESALIAGLPQAPSRYSPYQNMKYAKERRAMVLERMVKMGYITPNEAEIANNTPIKLSKNHRPYALNKAPYFVNYVMREINTRIGLSEQEVMQGGYKVFTTLNYGYQRVAQDKVDSNATRWGLRKPSQQIALLSLDVASGKILAYLGGKDFTESQYDRVTQSVRQPGSAFKPFVYAAALEKLGYNPKDRFDDTPFTYGNWKPHNYGHKYRGKITLANALAYSSNVIASRLIKDVGVQSVVDIARALGISTFIANDPTIALGSSGVKLFEITSAYSVFANGGMKSEPYSVEKIETSTGKVIYEAEPSSQKVLSTRTAAYMVSMLQGVIQKGTGKAANIGRPAAGKTGTTDSYRDAWFIGFTPDIVTGVWVGNDNNTPMRGLTGGTVPATIWGQYMRTIASIKGKTDFVYPEIIVDPKKMDNQQNQTATNSSSGNNDNIIYEDGTSSENAPVEEHPEPIPPPQHHSVPVSNPTPPVPIVNEEPAPAQSTDSGSDSTAGSAGY